MMIQNEADQVIDSWVASHLEQQQARFSGTQDDQDFNPTTFAFDDDPFASPELIHSQGSLWNVSI